MHLQVCKEPFTRSIGHPLLERPDVIGNGQKRVEDYHCLPRRSTGPRIPTLNTAQPAACFCKEIFEPAQVARMIFDFDDNVLRRPFDWTAHGRCNTME